MVLACKAANGMLDVRVEELRSRISVVFLLKFPAQLIVPVNPAALNATLTHEDLEEEKFPELPESLKVCAVDDSKLICKGYEKVLFSKMKVDKDISHVVCSKSLDDIERFKRVALGDKEAADGIADPPADIVILDQHLEFSGVRQPHKCLCYL
jgi:hypothetical protein